MSEAKHSREPWQYGWNTTEGLTGSRCAPTAYLDETGTAEVPIHCRDDDGRDRPVAWALSSREEERPALEVDARRIVAAVNAVEGIPTESLERGDLARALDLLAAGAVGEAVMGPSAAGDVLRALGRLKP